jgi:hypothetical protein
MLSPDSDLYDRFSIATTPASLADNAALQLSPIVFDDDRLAVLNPSEKGSNGFI